MLFPNLTQTKPLPDPEVGGRRGGVKIIAAPPSGLTCHPSLVAASGGGSLTTQISELCSLANCCSMERAAYPFLRLAWMTWIMVCP